MLLHTIIRPSIRQTTTALCGLILSLCLSSVQALTLTDYKPGDWQALIASAGKSPLIVHFWGFTCGPCLEELPRWGAFLEKNPALKTIFIEVDQVPESASLKALHDAHLDLADLRVSTAYFDEYMRYEIDPKWMGELPLTLLISPQGEVKRLRGTVDFADLRKWLNTQ